MLGAEVVIVTGCLGVTAFKIFSKKIEDWFPATIWGISVVNLVQAVVYLIYVNHFDFITDAANNLYLKWLNTANAFLCSLLIWAFTWGLFQTSMEISERLNQQPHKFKSEYRRAFNIIVVCIMLTAFVLGAALGSQDVNGNSGNLFLFTILSSVFFLWTYANINRSLA